MKETLETTRIMTKPQKTWNCKSCALPNRFRLFGRAFQEVERARHAVPLLKKEARWNESQARIER
jgi:hypothetical protein